MPTEYVVTHEEDLLLALEIVTVSATSKSLPITYSILSDTVVDEFFRIEDFSEIIYLRNKVAFDFYTTLLLEHETITDL